MSATANPPLAVKASFGDNDDMILALNQTLLNAIVQGDFETYDSLCADDLTCFEPEALDMRVHGKPFHKFYFDLPPKSNGVETRVTMCDAHVRRINKEVAIVTYVRLNQSVDADGKPVTTKSCETRVWQRHNLEWKNVHFHRS